MSIEAVQRMDIESFRRYVSNKKLKQIHAIWLLLKRSEYHPEDNDDMGIFWFNDFQFIINTGICAKFLGRKANTMNRGFRSHYFSYKKSSAAIREAIPKEIKFIEFSDQKNWILRFCDGFTKNTTEDEAMKWKCRNLIPKKKRSKCPEKVEVGESENWGFFFHLIENEKNYDGGVDEKNVEEIQTMVEASKYEENNFFDFFEGDNEFTNLNDDYFENEEKFDSSFFSDGHISFL